MGLGIAISGPKRGLGEDGVEIVGPVVTIRSRMKSTDIPALEALADAVLA